LHRGVAAQREPSTALEEGDLPAGIGAALEGDAAPAAVELKFSETLVPQSSAAKLVMTGMPGMANHGAMTITAGVAAAGDGKTMLITPAQPLPPGSYRVDWRAVSSDTRPVTGSISFEVN